MSSIQTYCLIKVPISWPSELAVCEGFFSAKLTEEYHLFTRPRHTASWPAPKTDCKVRQLARKNQLYTFGIVWRLRFWEIWKSQSPYISKSVNVEFSNLLPHLGADFLAFPTGRRRGFFSKRVWGILSFQNTSLTVSWERREVSTKVRQ